MPAHAPGPGETLDSLVGSWRLLQLARGHRFSADDMLCAWAAQRARPHAVRLLDLGAGIGSVGLMTLWQLPPAARLVMVEVQRVSHDLARRSIALNGLEGRVEARLGDLRDPTSVPEQAAFDLITCSPPYIPEGRGVASPVPQRAGARLELRGDVFDYLRTAQRALAPGGRVALVHAAADPRPPRAIAEAGLATDWWCEVFFRSGRPASLALYVAGHPADLAGPAQPRPPVVLRDRAGRWSGVYRELRRELGYAT
jgi:tRNA1Val (adenine37-N6)-methyltransferase